VFAYQSTSHHFASESFVAIGARGKRPAMGDPPVPVRRIDIAVWQPPGFYVQCS